MGQVENGFPLLEDVVDVRLRMVPMEGNPYTLILPVDPKGNVEEQVEKWIAHFLTGRACQEYEILPQEMSPSFAAPCKLGDSAFVLYTNEESGLTDIDEFKITDISYQRFWLDGEFDLCYNFESIGKHVFLSRESAEQYAVEHGMTLAEPEPKPDLDALIQYAESCRAEGVGKDADGPQREAVLPWDEI